LKGKIPLADVKQITIIKSSSAMLALQSKESQDMIMELVRRTEFLVFFISVFDSQKIPRPLIVNSVELTLKKTVKKQATI